MREEDIHKHQSDNYQKLVAENIERLKELAAINETTKIVREGKPINETLHKICLVLPRAWQYPSHTVARIIYQNKKFVTPAFVETKWILRQPFETIDGRHGVIEVFYTKSFPELDEGPFLEEERHLINNLAEIIVGYLNSVKAETLIHKKQPGAEEKSELESDEDKISRELLFKFFNRQNAYRDIYHDLMPFKVKEILVVATLYDAYSIEQDGFFTEKILGEYHQLNLTSLPRVTGVSSIKEARKQLKTKHYDLVIIMMGVDKTMPTNLSQEIKTSFPYIPVYLLANNNKDIAFFLDNTEKCKAIDKVFSWNGDSRIFFAMVKSVEDMVNVDNDTELGLVGVILLVEDSPNYYSRYLPMLYSIVLEQTKQLIEEVSTDELYKVFKLRARPKILLASNYEEAIDIINKFRNYVLCLITDMAFDRKNEMDKLAGVKLVNYAREKIRDLPTIIQSSNPENADRAYDVKASFINKNSETLLQDFKSFITYYLGFGNFIYRNSKGHEIAVARSLKEFEARLATIPADSLVYHANKNHFSLWLMARGEIQIAKILQPVMVKDFEDPEKLREYIIETINKYRYEQNKGKVVPYEESMLHDEKNILTLSAGSLGGKGRGLAFINTLIYNIDIQKLSPGIHLKTPITSIIGTDEFEYFLTRNNLNKVIFEELEYKEIKRIFVNGKLNNSLIKKLRKLLNVIHKPLAIRSSGLFEDSLMQPFAGIFETYIIPNNHDNFEERLTQLTTAIKLVYASVYSKIAKGYIKAINYRVEQEKMAVVIQELVGKRFGNYYYPHISGVAQSYNYYPVGNMKPNEGFAITCLGLGKYVVEGEKAYRFSPKHPGVQIKTPKDQYKDSQLDFLAVDLKNKNVDLLEGETAALKRLDLYDAEMHGSLKHCASAYDSENDRIEAGIDKPGPRIVNFANILRYNYIPLAKTIDTTLNVVKEAFGSPVEIEFAVDLTKDSEGKASFYLLQIKPLIGDVQDFNINMEDFESKDILLYTQKAMGNGIVKGIRDVVYVDKKTFDKTRTMEIAEEIEKINNKLQSENKQYILIGPGRWGTRDRFLGVPVTWPQICNAKIIVETSLKGFPLDASLGSHFFHNVTSMNVGYFTVHYERSDSYIRWDILEKQNTIESTNFVKHIKFKNPLTIRMDGKKRLSLITMDETDK